MLIPMTLLFLALYFLANYIAIGAALYFYRSFFKHKAGDLYV